MIPGEVLPGDQPIRLNDGKTTIEVEVQNTADRPIQVGSHYHFFEVNRALTFDRAASYGRRLDIPAGTAVRFEPGERRTVTLIELGGNRVVHGLNGLVNGSLAERDAALNAARERGFGGL